MDSSTEQMSDRGQILIESLIVVIIFSSILLSLGLFFQKSEKAIQRYQFQETYRERKTAFPTQR
jgi:type II secretory pathway pseudopilin PulG